MVLIWKKSYFRFPVFFKGWLTSIADEPISPVLGDQEDVGASALASGTGGPSRDDPLWNVTSCPQAECGVSLAEDVVGLYTREQQGNLNPRVVEDIFSPFFSGRIFQQTAFLCY